MSSQGPIDPTRELLAETQRILAAQAQLLTAIDVVQKGPPTLMTEIAALKTALARVETS